MEPFTSYPSRSRTQKHSIVHGTNQFMPPPIPALPTQKPIGVKPLNANAPEFVFRPILAQNESGSRNKNESESKSKREPVLVAGTETTGTLSPLPPPVPRGASKRKSVRSTSVSVPFVNANADTDATARLNERVVAASKRSVAHRRIGKFMRTHRSKITATYLARMCTDANECMAFGHGEYQRIRDFFNFTSFEYAPTPVHMLQSNSSQGQVGIVRYAREKYTAAAILKIAKTSFADSPYYEFTVGRFVNEHLIDAYPCFTETYGLLSLQKDAHRQLKSGAHEVNFSKQRPSLFVSPTTPLSQLTGNPELIRKACNAGASLGLLAQYFDRTWSLKELSYHDVNFCANDAYALLFQLYGPLASVADHFTHYDLHGGNVLLVPAPSGTCIQMHYHMPGGNSVTFKTKYIAKIIDYGRCFFQKREGSQGGKKGDKDTKDAKESSAYMSKVLCGSALCTGKCGSKSGFWLDPANPSAPVQVTPIKRNQSIDLLCAYEFLRRVSPFDSTRELAALFAQLPPIFDRTPYQITDGNVGGKGGISTVTVLAAVLWNKMGTPEYTRSNEKMHANRAVYGNLHVHLANRPGVPVQAVSWS